MEEVEMVRSRLGLKALILFGILANLSVFGASGAQATPGAKWYAVNPATGKLAELTFTAQISQDTEVGKLLTKIAGITTVFSCTSTEATALLEKEGNVNKGATALNVTFKGCKTSLNGAESKACVLKNNGTEEGVIKTKPLHGLLVLHELAGGVKDHLIELLPVSGLGGTFLTMEMGAECAIGTKVPVIGKLFLQECPTSKQTLLEEVEKHLLEEGPLSELFVISKTAEHAAKLDGSWWALLIGEHKDWKFGGTTP